MTKISTKELIICIIAIVTLILAITTNVFATTPSLNELLNDVNNVNSYNTIPGENNTANNIANKVTNNTTNNITNNVVNNTTKNNVANNNTNKNNTAIPNTGLDQSIVFVIAIFGVSALYAYKKIRDYKNV